MTPREIMHALRGLVTRGLVSAADDTGETQTVDVTARQGARLTAVEVAQPFGLASNAPAGGLVVLLAVGGDQGDLVALPVGAPSARLGKLAPGEVAIYCADGSRVHVRADGTIDVLSSTAVHAKVTGGGELDLTTTMVRGRMESGERFVAAGGVAKLVVGGHFLAATPDGLRASGAVTIGAEPSPEL